MSKGNTNLYYSINTRLAHHINEEYYGGTHFVWCSPIFDPSTSGKYSSYSATGPTSNPHEIYCELKKHVASGDKHSAKIKENKSGLLVGATYKLNEGIIDATDFGYIQELIETAELVEFTPYIYLIPAAKISPTRLIRVSPKDAATTRGVEYKIQDLKSSEFDIIEVKQW